MIHIVLSTLLGSQSKWPKDRPFLLRHSRLTRNLHELKIKQSIGWTLDQKNVRFLLRFVAPWKGLEKEWTTEPRSKSILCVYLFENWNMLDQIYIFIAPENIKKNCIVNTFVGIVTWKLIKCCIALMVNKVHG